VLACPSAPGEIQPPNYQSRGKYTVGQAVAASGRQVKKRGDAWYRERLPDRSRPDRQ